MRTSLALCILGCALAPLYITGFANARYGHLIWSVLVVPAILAPMGLLAYLIHLVRVALRRMAVTRPRAAWTASMSVNALWLLVGVSVFMVWHTADGYLSVPTKLSFADFDAKFGANIVKGFEAMTQTSEQRESKAQEQFAHFDEFKGKRVRWRGTVMDVRGGQILIQHDAAHMTNEVALIPFFLEKDKLDRVRVGQPIEYSGTINAVGDPYPFTLIDGKIESATP